MNDRATVLFDGSNFYHGVKRCWSDFHLTQFNYMAFEKFRSVSLTVSATSTQYISLSMLKKSGIIDFSQPNSG